MFRVLLALLLVNTFSKSFVSPLPTKVSNSIVVSDLLTALAEKCKHPFLSAQINGKLKDCNIQVTPFNEKQFECLSFYDINHQLCDAVTTAKLALTVNDTTKLNEPVDIDKLCGMAKLWNVTNIPEYPTYKNTVEQIFNSQVTCVKVCGVDDILSQEVNAFCKYFKWGAELLSRTVSTTADIYVDLSEKPNNNIQLEPSEKSNVLLIKKPSNDTLNTNDPSKEITSKTAELKPAELATVDQPQPPVSIQSWSTNRVAPSTGTGNASEKNHLEPNGLASSVPQEPLADPSLNNIDTSNVEMEKPSAAEVQPLKKEDAVKLEDQPKNLPIDEKDPSLANEKSKSQNVDAEDYQGDSDLDDGKDLTLTDGVDDGEDAISDPDIKQDQNLPKKPTKKIESMVSYNNGEMELFPNAMQEGFSDDDDHFFSFFLTAVVLVILLYVLYHNKNKVSKVVLGLIVEGRQSGRRRNSRGHAYRRLDTLEQAMSANTAAPPSKIIY